MYGERPNLSFSSNMLTPTSEADILTLPILQMKKENEALRGQITCPRLCKWQLKFESRTQVFRMPSSIKQQIYNKFGHI